MKTIAATVSQYVKNKPYLASALSDGIINLTSLARKIHPDIEAMMNKPINQGAIIMSLKEFLTMPVIQRPKRSSKF